MISRMDALRLAVSWFVIVVCGGCALMPSGRTEPPAVVYRPFPRQDSLQDAPLRITDPPAPLTLAQAQAPVLPPQAPPRSPEPIHPTSETSVPLPPLPSLPVIPPPSPPAAPPNLPPLAPAATALEDPLHRLHRQATEVYAGIDSYIVRLIRREQVNGKNQPQEIMPLEFRKVPFSVHLVWLAGENKGREVIYVQGQHENKLHTRMVSGMRLALAPDSFLVRSASRHSITEAGIGSLIDQFGRMVTSAEKTDPAPRDGGVSRFAEATGVRQTSGGRRAGHSPRAEKENPGGGRRWWFFDSTWHLPMLVMTQDERGKEVEYYCHNHLLTPVKLDDSSFAPDLLWGKSRP